MSIRTDASGDSLTRTTNLPTITAWTMMAWVYLVTRRDTGNMLAFGDSTTPNGNYYQVYTNVSGQMGCWNGAVSGGTSTGSTLSATTWYHIAMVCDGTGAGNHRIYLNGVLDITNSGATDSAAQRLQIGNSPDDEWCNGRFAGIKVWSATLTATEILQEMQTLVPRRLTNINCWSPGFPGATERLADYSGVGGNWTSNGTLADEDPPPVSYGAPVWLVGNPTGVAPTPTSFIMPQRKRIRLLRRWY